jgi:hypothetical protein
MDDPIPALPTALAAPLSRRDALSTYVPPALSVVALAGATNLSTSGKVSGGNGKSNAGGNGKSNAGGNGKSNAGGKKK